MKGQVTIFVIIGAVILLAAGLYFALTESLTANEPGVDVPDVSLESRPAVEQITGCLHDTAKQGLIQIGFQGGYINPIPAAYPPYKARAVEYPPGTVPYWRYLDDCDNPSGCERVEIPPLCKPGVRCEGLANGAGSIQEQLEGYIDTHIDNCINGFESLAELYNIEIEGQPHSEVQFREGEVELKLDYPITMKSLSTGNTRKVNVYGTQLDVDILQIYDKATQIVRFERESNHYERKTMSLIDIYSGVDAKLPPTANIEFFATGYTPWIQEEVKEIVQYDVLPFMEFTQYLDSKNYRPIEEEFEYGNYTQYSDGIYHMLTEKLSEEKGPYDLNIYHRYLYQPIFLQIGDGSPVITPGTISAGGNPLMQMFMMIIKDYRFKYFLSYPLVLVVEDDHAFDGEGYQLQFALEINIRNNVPGYDNFSDTGITAPSDPSLVSFASLLPQNITFTTKDKYTQEPLSDVLISYVCGREYEIGVTKIQANGQAQLTAQLPYCEFGGFVRYQRQGYLGEAYEFNNHISQVSMEITPFELWPTRKKQIIIRKRSAQDIETLDNAGTGALAYWNTAITNLTPNESVMFTMERIKTSPYDTNVPLVGFINYQESSGTTQTSDAAASIMEGYERGYYNESVRDDMIQRLNEAPPLAIEEKNYTMELVPSTYAIDGQIIDRGGIFIPATTYDPTDDNSDIVTQVIMSAFGPDTEVDLPEQNLSVWFTGGAKINITLNAYDIYQRDEPLVFNMLEMPKPTTWFDLMESQTLEDYQQGKEYYIFART